MNGLLLNLHGEAARFHVECTPAGYELRVTLPVVSHDARYTVLVTALRVQMDPEQVSAILLAFGDGLSTYGCSDCMQPHNNADDFCPEVDGGENLP